jgi:hypothetical protein
MTPEVHLRLGYLSRKYLLYSMSEGKKAEDKEGEPRLSGDEVLERVSKYFYEDEALAKGFEAFIDSRSSVVDLDSPEYKLEYTAAYEEYKELFEDKIGNFITSKLGSSIELFYETLQKRTDEDPNSNEAIFGQILVSVCDFEIFVTALKESAVKLKKHRGNDDGPSSFD